MKGFFLFQYLHRFVLLAALFALPCTVVAKDVKIKWKPIKHAKKYELEITSPGQTTRTLKIDDNVWKGDLPHGVYAYRIRAIDKFNREGKWSKEKPLAVMPDAPEFIAPESAVSTYRVKGNIPIRWRRPENLKRVRLRVMKKNQEIVNKVIEGDQYVLENVAPGDYRVEIAPNLEARGLASIGDKAWDGKDVTTKTVTLEQKEMSKPNPTYPTETILPSSQLRFTWVPVEGAEAYEVQLKREDNDQLVKKFMVKSASAVLGLQTLQDQKFKWSVRALASVEKDSVGVYGPTSTADFKVDAYGDRFDERGYVAMSTLFANYNYYAYDPNNGGGGQLSSNAVNLRLNSEWFVTPSIAISGSIDHYAYQIMAKSYSTQTFDLGAKYRLAIFEGKNGLVFYPKVGVQHRGFFFLTPQFDNFTGDFLGIENFYYNTYGPYVGFDLRQGLFGRLSVGVKFMHFFQMGISSGDGNIAGLAKSTYNNRNTSIGVQGIYYIGGSFSAGLGFFHDSRSVAFTPGRAPASANTEENLPNYMTMDATYLFGSIIYRFGE